MKQFLLLSIAIFLAANAISQNKNLNDYSYVIVPDQFEFLTGKDQFKINSMAAFYLEKSGFNTYLANVAPNASRCDGLYADVEELKSVLGTKLQVVLKDCNNLEVYRGTEGRSKYKDRDKKYQDALRDAFRGLEAMKVKQKEVVLLKNDEAVVEKKFTVSLGKPEEPKVVQQSVVNADIIIPEAKFSNYSYSGKTFLLRKTAEGFSLYEESTAANDGLLLKGNLLVKNNEIEYIDTQGLKSKATFDASGNLNINESSQLKNYKLQD